MAKRIENQKVLHLEFVKKISPAKHLKKILNCVRAAIRLKRIGENVQMFGTSPNLFDLTTRDRGFVKNFLYPLTDAFASLNEETPLPFPLIHPDGKLIRIWSFVVVILLAYTTTLMPYILVFYDLADDWSDPWFIFQNIVDILFWMDLLINMFSSYHSDEGVLVRDKRTVVIKYIKTWFIIDLLACIPFDLIENAMTGTGSNAKKIQLVRLSKLPRLYRVIKIAKILKLFQVMEQKSLFNDFFEFNSSKKNLFKLKT